jgi:hypothetical protein
MEVSRSYGPEKFNPVLNDRTQIIDEIPATSPWMGISPMTVFGAPITI